MLSFVPLILTRGGLCTSPSLFRHRRPCPRAQGGPCCQSAPGRRNLIGTRSKPWTQNSLTQTNPLNLATSGPALSNRAYCTFRPVLGPLTLGKACSWGLTSGVLRMPKGAGEAPWCVGRASPPGEPEASPSPAAGRADWGTLSTEG